MLCSASSHKARHELASMEASLARLIRWVGLRSVPAAARIRLMQQSWKVQAMNEIWDEA